MLSFNFDFFIRMLIALFTFFDFFIGQRKVIVFYSIDKSLPCGLSVLYKFGLLLICFRCVVVAKITKRDEIVNFVPYLEK